MPDRYGRPYFTRWTALTLGFLGAGLAQMYFGVRLMRAGSSPWAWVSLIVLGTAIALFGSQWASGREIAEAADDPAGQALVAREVEQEMEARDRLAAAARHDAASAQLLVAELERDLKLLRRPARWPFSTPIPLDEDLRQDEIRRLEHELAAARQLVRPAD